MNTPQQRTPEPGNGKDGLPLVRFGSRHVPPRVVFLFLATITAIPLFILITLAPPARVPELVVSSPPPKAAPPLVEAQGHAATDKLITRLKEHGLWELDPSRETVPPLFINSYPPDLNAVADIDVKKKVFLHSLLPHALYVREEALQRRERLRAVLYKIDCTLEDIHFEPGPFDGNDCAWSDGLAEEEVSFIQQLSRNYRTTSAEGLLERVDAVPTSIILAQGALESSWGSSRFTREGNSVFGMWTWKKKGIVPTRRDEGKTHKVKVYGSIRDSIRAYHLTLNRVSFYDRFRQLRKITDDPLVLAEGLSPYSERGEEYVEEIKAVITSNDLQQYDSCRLSDLARPELNDIMAEEQVKTPL